ncbi:MAG: hypothetical protein ACYC3I_27370 [Gemmataceae bacterium]
MSELTAQDQRYMVNIYESAETPGTLFFSFVPKGLQQERGPNGIPKRVPQFIVAIRQEAVGLVFDWDGTPDDPGAARDEIQAEIADRMKDRANWIDRVIALVDQVEQWAKEMGWSTRRVEKKLDDPWIGKHRVPALLMQEDTCRVLLEPIGRSTLGAEGIVDLYLMPAYDDIARLYYNGNQWNLHYMFPGAKPAATVREAESKPLSKETLAKVLTEMRQHAT